MPTIKVARSFQINGTDGVTYEFGIGVYDVSDAIADNWYVKHNLQEAVLSRGLALAQYRWLSGRQMFPGQRPMMIWIGTPYSPAIYGTEIEPGWEPTFHDDLGHFPALSLPPAPDFYPIGVDPVTGDVLYRPDFHADRVIESHHNMWKTPVVRVYPGDPSPPIARTPPPPDRSGEDVNDPRFVAAYPQLYPPDQPPDPAPIPWPRPVDPSVYTYRDPRQR